MLALSPLTLLTRSLQRSSLREATSCPPCQRSVLRALCNEKVRMPEVISASRQTGATRVRSNCSWMPTTDHLLDAGARTGNSLCLIANGWQSKSDFNSAPASASRPCLQRKSLLIESRMPTRTTIAAGHVLSQRNRGGKYII